MYAEHFRQIISPQVPVVAAAVSELPRSNRNHLAPLLEDLNLSVATLSGPETVR